MNALELTEDLKARTDLSDRDATGIVRTIARAVEDARSELVTRDYLDARLSDLRSELKGDTSTTRTELKTDIANLRVELHQTVRSQTVWIMSSMVAIAGLIIAGIKLIP